MSDWKRLFFRLSSLSANECVMDYNENHDPANGRFTNGNGGGIIQGMETKKSTVGSGKGAVEVNLGFGRGKPEFSAETTSKGHDTYHEKHAKDMGMNLRQWKQAAADLLNDEPREHYRDWENPQKESFNRFNVQNGRLVAGDKGGTINTFFKLDKGKYRYYLPKEYLDEIQKRK